MSVTANPSFQAQPICRMYEEGQVESAEQEKLRLEQKQRTYLKSLREQGEKWTPKWFENRSGGYEAEDAEGMKWAYKGGYFEQRGNFGEVLNLWA